MFETKASIDRANLEVMITRTFKASAERLFAAYTEPALVVQWWGPAIFETKVDELELKVGGKWRFIQTAPDGSVHAFNGVFKEIDEPNKIVQTFEYEPVAGHISTQTVTFEPVEPGLTKVVSVAKFANIEDLDGMVSNGMETGSSEGNKRLAALVEVE